MGLKVAIVIIEWVLEGTTLLTTLEHKQGRITSRAMEESILRLEWDKITALVGTTLLNTLEDKGLDDRWLADKYGQVTGWDLRK